MFFPGIWAESWSVTSSIGLGSPRRRICRCLCVCSVLGGQLRGRVNILKPGRGKNKKRSCKQDRVYIHTYVYICIYCFCFYGMIRFGWLDTQIIWNTHKPMSTLSAPGVVPLANFGGLRFFKKCILPKGGQRTYQNGLVSLKYNSEAPDAHSLQNTTDFRTHSKGTSHTSPGNRKRLRLNGTYIWAFLVCSLTPTPLCKRYVNATSWAPWAHRARGPTFTPIYINKKVSFLSLGPTFLSSQYRVLGSISYFLPNYWGEVPGECMESV